MNDVYSHSAQGTQAQVASKKRRSAWITIGVVAAVVIGVPVILSQCGEDEDPVVDGQEYENNYYVPGAGYYHSGYHSFYPYRFNHYDVSLGGYYYGGGWHSSADTTSRLTSSVPHPSATAKANSSFRATSPSSRGGFGKSGSFFSSGS
jgi:hypothetical protein